MIIKSQKHAYLLSLRMMHQVIEKADDATWTSRLCGHFFWQQILHALMGTYFWFRDGEESFETFNEPFKNKGYEPEFEHEPKNHMPKEEMLGFYDTVKKRVDAYFDGKTDAWLEEPSKLYPKMTHNDIIGMQIRHMMYHVGYCGALLKEHQQTDVTWINESRGI